MSEEDRIQLNIVHSNFGNKVKNSPQDDIDAIILQSKKPQILALSTKSKLISKKTDRVGLVVNKKTLKSTGLLQKKVKVSVNPSRKEVKVSVNPSRKEVKVSVKPPKKEASKPADNSLCNSRAKSILKKTKTNNKHTTVLGKRKRVSFIEKGEGSGDEDDKEEVEPTKKIFKTATLFSNNPKIPKVDRKAVIPVSENVFSKTPFSSLKLHPFMVSNLEKMNITTATVVQKKAIPVIMDKRDLLLKSQTGSGKTMSYAVPIIQDLQSMVPKIKRTDGPYCIVVVPTRELVIQSHNVLDKLVKPFVWVVPGYLMGGEKRKSEKARIKKGMNIIVSTPARLMDHLDNTSSLELGNIRYLVIDEADRMLDMGFEKDVSRIVMVMNKKCNLKFQTILLSATLTPGVEKLAGMSLLDPIRIDMALGNKKISEDGTEVSEEFATPSSLRHNVAVVPTKLRLVTLAAFLLWKCQLNKNPCKVIVFFSTQDAVEFHHSLFQSTFFSPDDDDEACKDFEIFKLYGNMDQKDRTKVFSDFAAAKSGVLLTTDVASRGLDLPRIEWIVQYNTPGTPTDYIHRAGRTARIGTKGNALLFLAPSEIEYVKVMAEHKIAMNEIQMDDILKTLLLKSQTGKINLVHKGHIANTLQDAAAFLQNQFQENLSQNVNMRTMARRAYQSFIKAYATYPASLKYIFHIKNLHLGHVTTSFALSETPGNISKLVGKHCKNQRAALKKFMGRKIGGKVTSGAPRPNRIKVPFGFDKIYTNKRPQKNYANMSEFDAGL